MSDVREALRTLRENVRQEGRTVQQVGIRDNGDTRNAIAVLLDNEAALQQTAPQPDHIGDTNKMADHSPDAGKVECHAPGDRCRACPHYFGKSDRCDYDISPCTAFDAGKVVQGDPVALLVREIGEDTWFDHLPVKPGSPEAEAVKKSPELDYCPVYTHPAESREEIQAQALEEYAAALDKVFAAAQDAKADNCPAWHAGEDGHE